LGVFFSSGKEKIRKSYFSLFPLSLNSFSKKGEEKKKRRGKREEMEKKERETI
jgi:hypothetical protein